MSQIDDKFTFSHFVDAETLTKRTRDMGGKYSEEQVAATAFYLATLALAGFQQVVPIYGDEHYVMHLLANVYAGEWMSTMVEEAALDPEKVHDFALKEWGPRLGLRKDGMEDIKSPAPEAKAPETKPEDDHPPMDPDTFRRLWGTSK